MNKLRIYRNGQLKFWNLYDLVEVLKFNDKKANHLTIIEDASEYNIVLTVGHRTIKKMTEKDYNDLYKKGKEETDKKVYIVEKR